MQTIVHGATRIGIGFVPFVGPALDLCEAVSGHEWCLPSGRVLSTEERILSGVGFGVGKVVKVWKGVSSAAISTEGKLAAAGIVGLGKYGDELAELLAQSRRQNYKGLIGKALPVANEFEAKAGVHLMKNEGRAMIGISDEGVRKVLGIPSESLPNTTLGAAPDFLTVTPGNKLALSEVKGAVKEVDAAHAVEQLQNAMSKLKEQNRMGDLDRVELIMRKDIPFKDKLHGIKDGYLVNKETGLPIKIDGFPLHFVKVIQL